MKVFVHKHSLRLSKKPFAEFELFDNNKMPVAGEHLIIDDITYIIKHIAVDYSKYIMVIVVDQSCI